VRTEQAAEARAARVEAAQAVLADAVTNLRSSEDWTRFLDFQSRLYGYSANNVLLIIAQYRELYGAGKVSTPMPSYVASYRRWQQVGRQVIRGQTGLAIIAPMRGIARVATDDDGTVVRVLHGDETPASGEHEALRPWMRGFTIEKVFAAEQTTGDPIPSAPAPRLLSGEAPRGLGEAVLKLIESRGFTVSTVSDARQLQGANGLTSFVAKTVQVRADMDDAAMVKTALHEAAHVLMHAPDDGRIVGLSRGHREVEAESVAFIVARVHGMPTDEYSFPYVAAWAGDDPLNVVAKTAQRVATTAKEIIALSPAQHSHGGKAALRLAPTRSAAVDTDAALIGT
jgi:biotin carboxyl carrier protein